MRSALSQTVTPVELKAISVVGFAVISFLTRSAEGRLHLRVQFPERLIRRVFSSERSNESSQRYDPDSAAPVVWRCGFMKIRSGVCETLVYASGKETVREAISLKKNPLEFQSLGQGKTICLLFFNNSLRTRLSTQKAAQNLGLNAIVMNFGSEGWQLEYGDGTIMNQNKSEHVKEAAKVVSQYCDIVAIRAFAGLENKEQDEAELVINSFIKHASVPVVNTL